ncbi:MAG: DUF4255 domain-containing protein [Candidatus Paraimprobicoccus trichonymphae]|uniref:DUF4255 domain-containing protein n=1 Tax=Candidatus Paraimprobicoccus trichonymphae TaxID=3033793 RepID=A0AA48HZX7_9FIRM|nr:MAG: DUF4255 domain-containing protein [Candidatus Paraimprobicoccus trichonymphae]
MAKYTIISDIEASILNILRDKLVPMPIDSSESIGICEPSERGDYIVGIHSYDMKEIKSSDEPKTVLPDGNLKDPPMSIELYYMVSVNSKAELEAKAKEEAIIIGKIMQIFKDNPVIPKNYILNSGNEEIGDIAVTSLTLSTEEKAKIWAMFDDAHKISAFYMIGPVLIDSENITIRVPRVRDLFINSSQYVPEKEIKFETKITEEDIKAEEGGDEEESEEGTEEEGEDEEGTNEDSEEEGEESTEEGEDSDDENADTDAETEEDSESTEAGSEESTEESSDENTEEDTEENSESDKEEGSEDAEASSESIAEKDNNQSDESTDEDIEEDFENEEKEVSEDENIKENFKNDSEESSEEIETSSKDDT